MGHGGRTGERLEMDTAKEGEYIPVVEGIVSWLVRIV
jgi:hypothetical protein